MEIPTKPSEAVVRLRLSRGDFASQNSSIISERIKKATCTTAAFNLRDYTGGLVQHPFDTPLTAFQAALKNTPETVIPNENISQKC